MTAVNQKEQRTLRQLPPHTERGIMAVIRRFIRALLTVLFGRRRSRSRRSERQPESSPDDYLTILDAHPGVRITKVQILDRSSADRGILSRHEQVQSEDDRGNLIEIHAYHTPLCSFGHLLGRDVQPRGLCAVCGRLVCSTDGCAGACTVCGMACCVEHRTTHQLSEKAAVTYCSRCHWKHWWKLWWGLYP
jgi:hypothetical protein